MHVLIFAVEEREYALDVTAVVEVLRMVALTALPDTPEWLSGVVNLRGRIIPVMDLRRRLQVCARPPDTNTPIIIVQAGAQQLGMIVDRLNEVSALPAACVETISTSMIGQALVRHLARLDQRVVMILDPAGLAESIPTIR